MKVLILTPDKVKKIAKCIGYLRFVYILLHFIRLVLHIMCLFKAEKSDLCIV
jgi:hypothetical protein